MNDDGGVCTGENDSALANREKALGSSAQCEMEGTGQFIDVARELRGQATLRWKAPPVELRIIATTVNAR